MNFFHKVINSGLAKKGEGFQKLFKFCYEYRRKAVANGDETPIMDFVIFRSLRMIFGGRLKFIATGEVAFALQTNVTTPDQGPSLCWNFYKGDRLIHYRRSTTLSRDTRVRADGDGVPDPPSVRSNRGAVTFHWSPFIFTFILSKL